MCGAGRKTGAATFYLPELFPVFIQAGDDARNVIRSNYFEIYQFGIFSWS